MDCGRPYHTGSTSLAVCRFFVHLASGQLAAATWTCAVLWLTLAWTAPVAAALAFEPTGARAGGMGDAFSAVAGGAEVVFWNPAALAWSVRTECVATVGRPFGMAELQAHALGLARSAGPGAMGLGYRGMGCELYREQCVALGWAVALRKQWGLGLRLRWAGAHVLGGNPRRWGLVDLGVQLRVRSGLSLGMWGWNAAGTGVAALGQGGALGFSTPVGPSTVLTADVQKEAGLSPGYGVGLEHRVCRALVLRMGAGGQPERLCAGAGVRRGSLVVDYAASYHTVLGVSHRVSLGYARGPR